MGFPVQEAIRFRAVGELLGDRVPGQLLVGLTEPAVVTPRR
jgi:hypothetical protein